MAARWWQLVLVPTLLVFTGGVALTAAPDPVAPAEPAPVAISGRVRDATAPVSGAVVRIQNTQRSTVTDSVGRFTLPVAGLGEGPFPLTAWAPGYYCAGPVAATAGSGDLEIHLEAHAGEDNPEYAWLPSVPHPETGPARGCAECHSGEGTDPPYTLPVDEWRLDAHSRSAVNPRFLTLYRGTDTAGRRSPPTRYGLDPDYGVFPLPPDPGGPDYGPGYQLDFPDTAGSCAACHTPAAAVAAPHETDPTRVGGVAAEGVPCDFCHKVWAVRLDSETGLPHPQLPGVLSFELRRPPPGHQLFIGPLDDVAPGEDTFSPLQRESRFCAPCHFGVFWDTVVYNSFGEWLASPYSDPESGRTCQDCHMPRLGARHFVRPDKGGLLRDPQTIFSHRMPGASDQGLLENAVTLTARARRAGARLVVEVEITNDRTGHHVPSDSPLRHLILLVRAVDGDGRPMVLLVGPRLPEWCGVGDPEDGRYSGLPGKVFAKVLEELWTGVAPTAAYWNPTRVRSDNRLAALATDVSSFVFDATGQEVGLIEVTLLYRRAFIELMDRKGWNVPDFVMASRRLTLPIGDAEVSTVPWIFNPPPCRSPGK